MASAAILALVNIGTAILIAGLSIPLILRKVPMNDIYGVRFPQSFKSDEAWYEINEYGGKALLIASVPIFLVGLLGWFWQPAFYHLVESGVLILSLVLACLMSYLKARKVEKETENQNAVEKE